MKTSTPSANDSKSSLLRSACYRRYQSSIENAITNDNLLTTHLNNLKNARDGVGSGTDPRDRSSRSNRADGLHEVDRAPNSVLGKRRGLP